MSDKDKLVVGFAYDEIQAVEALKKKKCNIVVIPCQEEDPKFPEELRDDWDIICTQSCLRFLNRISIIDALATKVSGYPEFFLGGELCRSLTELASIIGFNLDDIVRLDHDPVLDQHYFG